MASSTRTCSHLPLAGHCSTTLSCSPVSLGRPLPAVCFRPQNSSGSRPAEQQQPVFSGFSSCSREAKKSLSLAGSFPTSCCSLLIIVILLSHFARNFGPRSGPSRIGRARISINFARQHKAQNRVTTRADAFCGRGATCEILLRASRALSLWAPERGCRWLGAAGKPQSRPESPSVCEKSERPAGQSGNLLARPFVRSLSQSFSPSRLGFHAMRSNEAGEQLAELACPSGANSVHRRLDVESESEKAEERATCLLWPISAKRASKRHCRFKPVARATNKSCRESSQSVALSGCQL